MINKIEEEVRLVDTPVVLEGLKPIHPVGASVFVFNNSDVDVTAYVDHSTNGTAYTNVTSGAVVAKGWQHLFVNSSRKYVRLRISADAPDGVRFYITQPSRGELLRDLSA